MDGKVDMLETTILHYTKSYLGISENDNSEGFVDFPTLHNEIPSPSSSPCRTQGSFRTRNRRRRPKFRRARSLWEWHRPVPWEIRSVRAE